jgi:hypothetical protein
MGLFDFGRTKREAKRREQAAFQTGQQAARSMSDQLDQILVERYGHVKPGFLQVLSDGFDRDIAQKEHSPLICARANYAVYVENVAETIPRMTGDILAIMSAWRDGFTEMGMPTAVEDMLKHRLGTWQLDMQTAGLKLFQDRGDELIAADNLWRIQHPEQSALEPLD